MRRLAFLPLVAVLAAPSPCDVVRPPVKMGGDAGAAAVDGGPRGGTGAPLRDVTFFALPPGPYSGSTLDGVLVTLGPYGGGGPLALVQDRMGAGNDLVPSCATVTFAPPEVHLQAAIVVSDLGGAVDVAVYDAVGALLGSFSTRDPQTRGLFVGAGAYLRGPLKVQDAVHAIARIDIGTCDGLIHEVLFQ